MKKNVIITGPTGSGKSVVIARYWANNYKDTRLLDGIELKENFQIQFSNEEISELKECRVLILDCMFLEFPFQFQCMKTVLDILEFRYTAGKKIVIAEQSTTVMQRMNIPIVNKILEHSDCIQLTKPENANTALTELENLLEPISDKGTTKNIRSRYIYVKMALILWAIILVYFTFCLEPPAHLDNLALKEADIVARQMLVIHMLRSSTGIVALLSLCYLRYNISLFNICYFVIMPLGSINIFLVYLICEWGFNIQ